MAKWHIRTDSGKTACGRQGDLTVDRADFYRRINSDRCQRCETADKSESMAEARHHRRVEQSTPAPPKPAGFADWLARQQSQPSL